MSNNKYLSIPSINELDNLMIDEVSIRMDAVDKHAIDCVNWPDIYDYRPDTTFSIAHSNKYIYIKFQVTGEDLRAVNTENLSPVAQDSCVEFFMQVPGSEEYWNFEFNCIGTVNASHRVLRPNAIRLNDEQISSIKRHSSCGNIPFDERHGIHSWSLTVAVPKSLVNLTNEDCIMGNFYKCADKTAHPHYVSWNSIQSEKPNFHTPQFFGKLSLE